MNCPKCKTKMYQELEECRQQYAGGGVRHLPELVYKCWNCATRATVEKQPVMQLTPEQKQSKLPNARLKDRTLETLRPYMPSIRKLRSGKQPATWLSIANIIRQATGSRIKPETVKRHYYAEMGMV